MLLALPLSFKRCLPPEHTLPFRRIALLLCERASGQAFPPRGAFEGRRSRIDYGGLVDSFHLSLDLHEQLEEAAQGLARQLFYCEQVSCVFRFGVVFLEVVADLILKLFQRVYRLRRYGEEPCQRHIREG